MGANAGFFNHTAEKETRGHGPLSVESLPDRSNDHNQTRWEGFYLGKRGTPDMEIINPSLYCRPTIHRSPHSFRIPHAAAIYNPAHNINSDIN